MHSAGVCACQGVHHAGNRQISALATHVTKGTHSAVQALASELQLRVLAIGAAELSKMTTKTQSDRVAGLYRAGSIAEAAALAAAGNGTRLTCVRMISDDGMAVAAITEGDMP